MDFKVALVGILKFEVFFRHGAVSMGLVGVEGVVGFGCDAYINSLQTGKRRKTADARFHKIEKLYRKRKNNLEPPGVGRVWSCFYVILMKCGGS